MKRALSIVALVSMNVAIACGGAGPDKPAVDPGAASAAGADGGTATSVPEASAPEHPFAETPQQATSMIDDVITAHSAELGKCVQDARTRRKDPHAKVSVDLGIDQEGTFIGAKPTKGQPSDHELEDCFRRTLTGAPFPRSRAGVITVTKSFSDQVIYR